MSSTKNFFYIAARIEICYTFSKLNTRINNPIFDSQIYQNTAESLILPGFFSGAFSFYYIVFFLNQIWMIDFYDFPSLGFSTLFFES